VRLQLNGFEIPDDFALLFAPNELARSGRYKVVWRLGKDVGAKFISPAPLPEFDWLPTRHGALLKTLPVHEPNDIYDTTFQLFTLQSPFRMNKTAHAIELLSDNRFVDLGANLRYFREKYDAILASRNESRDALASVRGTPDRRVARLHYDDIKKQRAEVDLMLNRLSTLENSPAAQTTQ
jgi:hypothetical protein